MVDNLNFFFTPLLSRMIVLVSSIPTCKHKGGISDWNYFVDALGLLKVVCSLRGDKLTDNGSGKHKTPFLRLSELVMLPFNADSI